MRVHSATTILGFGLGMFHASATAKTDWEEIHDTLNLYSIFVDTKDFASLSKVFAPNAYANYGGAWADLYGIDAIIKVCQESVAGHTSQHLGSVMGIDVQPKATVEPYRDANWWFTTLSRQNDPGAPINSTANSTTYDQSTLFAEPYYNGSVIYYFGYYLDELVKLEEGWRINNRTWIKAGPGYSGNYSVGTT